MTNLGEPKDRVLHQLHDRCGVCNHCGKRDCQGRSSGSVLPEILPMQDVLGAIEDAFGAHKMWDLIRHLHRQREWSAHTFGPGERTAGILDHIRKELKEIEASPKDLMEWVDLMLLAFDGAWRAGFTPEQITAGLEAKQDKNESRVWPDWRTADPARAIEHVRD